MLTTVIACPAATVLGAHQLPHCSHCPLPYLSRDSNSDQSLREFHAIFVSSSVLKSVQSSRYTALLSLAVMVTTSKVSYVCSVMTGRFFCQLKLKCLAQVINDPSLTVVQGSGRFSTHTGAWETPQVQNGVTCWPARKIYGRLII
jgi:hypothetical protein